MVQVLPGAPKNDPGSKGRDLKVMLVDIRSYIN